VIAPNPAHISVPTAATDLRRMGMASLLGDASVPITMMAPLARSIRAGENNDRLPERQRADNDGLLQDQREVVDGKEGWLRAENDARDDQRNQWAEDGAPVGDMVSVNRDSGVRLDSGANSSVLAGRSRLAQQFCTPRPCSSRRGRPAVCRRSAARRYR